MFSLKEFEKCKLVDAFTYNTYGGKNYTHHTSDNSFDWNDGNGGPDHQSYRDEDSPTISTFH